MKKLSLTDKTALLVVLRFANRSIGFLSTILLVRIFVPEVYGSFRQLMMIQNFALPLLSLALPNSLLYFIPVTQDQVQKRILASQTIYALALTALLSSTLVILGAGPIADAFNNPSLQHLLLIFSIVIAFAIAGNHFEMLMYAYDKIPILLAYSVCFRILHLILVLSAFLLKVSIESYLVMLASLYVIDFFVVLMLSIKVIGGLSGQVNFRTLLNQYAHSFPIYSYQTVNKFSFDIDLLMVAFFFNPRVFALYSVGAFEFPLLKFIRQAASNVLLPKLVELYRERRVDEFLNLFHEVVRKTAIIALPSFVLLMFISEPFVRVIFTDQYIEALNIFRVYLLLIPLQTVSFGSLVQSTGKTKPVLTNSIVYMIVNVSLVFVLLKAIGILGPAIATVVSLGLNNFMWLSLLSRVLQTPIGDIFPFRLFLKTLFFSFIAMIPTAILLQLVHTPWLALLLSGVIYPISCFLIFKYFKILVSGDLHTLNRWAHMLRLKVKGVPVKTEGV